MWKALGKWLLSEVIKDVVTEMASKASKGGK